MREYFKYIGEESRQNPFRNLSFKETVKAEVPPFENDWVRSKILVPGALDGIKDQARLIVYALFETGCRPSELANLREEDIFLDADAPYISIRPRRGREIKTASSIRDIPLVGVSLDAMKRAPKGFPHYRDRNDLLSQSLMSTFRKRGLLPPFAGISIRGAQGSSQISTRLYKISESFSPKFRPVKGAWNMRRKAVEDP